MRGNSRGQALRPVLLCLGSWVQAQVLAQPVMDLDRVLFEAHLLPAQAAAASDFVASAPQRRQSLVSAADRLPAPPAAPPLLQAANRPTQQEIAAYQQSLADIESGAGPFSLALAEQLLSLSDAFLREQRFEESIATLEKAEYINRINNGLNTPLQVEIVQRMVQTHLASGDFAAAFSSQQHLYYLNRELHGPGSPLLIPNLIEQGDLSMRSFVTGIRGSNSVGALMSFGSRARGLPLTPRRLALTSLDQAHSRYLQAIQLMVGAGRLHDPQLMLLEEKLLHCIYLAGHRRGLEAEPEFYLDGRVHLTGTRISVSEFETNMNVFLNGKYTLDRMALYLRTARETPVVHLIEVLLRLGDWHVLFNRSGEAGNYYHAAQSLADGLEARGFAADALLNPPLPVQLPTFMALPHSRGALGIADETPVRFTGHYDVEFSRSRSGDARRLRFVGSSGNTSKALERRLRRLLTAVPFRPQLQDGEPVSSETTRVRYYFAELPAPATEP